MGIGGLLLLLLTLEPFMLARAGTLFDNLDASSRVRPIMNTPQSQSKKELI